MRFYIYIDDDLKPKSIKARHRLDTAVDFAPDAVERAMNLVRTQTSNVKANTVYGPFDIDSSPNATRASFFYSRDPDDVY